MCNCSQELGKDCVVCSVDLWNSIEKDQIQCLNEAIPGSIKEIVRENRFQSQPISLCSSDCDGELLVKIAFKGSVKLTKIILNVIQDQRYIVKAFINAPDLDFSSISSRILPTQEWSLSGEKALYAIETLPYRFQNLNHITLFIKAHHQPAQLRHLGFEGEFKYSRQAPIITSYEVAPSAKKFEDTAEAMKKQHFS